MPGVPSSRACEACRKQKKKCNQVRPSCSRCTRLEIACIGSGKQRYKFVRNQPPIAEPPNRAPAAVHTLPVNVHGILLPPSNELTMATGAFCSVLGVTDVRYDLSVYGDFLKGIPSRLGSNAALDASVNALTLAFPSVHSRRQSVKVLESYIQALSALRGCLNDPVEARSANTLCAVYLITICQGWIGRPDDWCLGQGKALAHLLSYAASQGWQDGFETELALTACVMVIFEALANPRIQLNPWLEQLSESRDKAVFVESLKLRNLAKLPDFIRYPEAHLNEIKAAYRTHETDIPAVKRLLSSISTQVGPAGSIHSRYQAVYSIVLTYSIMLNTILCAFETNNVSLVEESAKFVQEIITLADHAMQYRPLGSSAMPICLIAAWAATNKGSTRVRIEEILAVYQTDFAIKKWMRIAYWLEKRLKKRSQTAAQPTANPLSNPAPQLLSTAAPTATSAETAPMLKRPTANRSQIIPTTACRKEQASAYN